MEGGMADIPQYVSTVFACDTSIDNRYVRCDFNQCEEHNRTKTATEWILNTHRNVKMLERHVGQKVYQYVSEYERAHGAVNKACFESNIQILENPLLLNRYSKIIIFLELRDKQAELGLWIQAFLDAAAADAGHLNESFCTITMSFASRLELMSCIGKLNKIRENNNHAEVMIVLSCHSSNQGQVFSCTPTYISADARFEEFCSLHDFVRSCQDVLKTLLKVIHISSCFTLKLDNSLVEWPVSYTWYHKELKCTLSGSTNEIYETGSQVADLYLILSIFVNQNKGGLEACFNSTLNKALESDWPDLANEMGLTVVNAGCVEEAIKLEAEEDNVTQPSVILSPINVLLITMDENTEGCSEIDHSKMVKRGDQEGCLLADAILQNLNVRKSSDINARFSRVSLDGRLNDTEAIHRLQDRMVEDSCNEFFFVFISRRFGKISMRIYEAVKEFCFQNNFKVYGMHFQNINIMSWRALSLLISDNLYRQTCCAEEYMKSAFPVTGSLNSEASCIQKYPVILYLIHLAVGENGLRRLKMTECQEKGRLISSRWSLADVYMETSYVLSGLASICDLKLLSPDNIYMRYNYSALENRIDDKSCHIHNKPLGDEIGIKNVSEMAESFTDISNDQTLCPHSSANMHDSKKDGGEPDIFIHNYRKDGHKRKLEDWSLENRGKLKLKAVDYQVQRSESVAKSNEDNEIAQHETLNEDTNIKSHAFRSNSVNHVSQTMNSRPLRQSESMDLTDNGSVTSVSPSPNIDYSKDLPLMANVDDVLVKHYILDLDVDFETKVISGAIVFLIESARLDANDCNFQMCLDSTMVTVDSVVEIALPDDLEIHFHDEKCCCMAVEDVLSPANKTFLDSNKKGGSTDCSPNRDTGKQCGKYFKESSDVCSSSLNNLADSLRYETAKEHHICQNEGVMYDCNFLYQNNPARCIDNDSQDSYSLNFPEANTTTHACSKEMASRSPSDNMIFKCRHCQFLNDIRGSVRNNSPLKFKKLAYSIHGWCIRVWKEGKDAKIWPRCIKLWYRTSPNGQSIMWAKDQDGNDTVFTPGAYINNRSLMPCQEPPIAMSTWQAYFHVKNGATVLMSGNRVPCKEKALRKVFDDPGLFYYEMSMPLPCSTLALAIGNFVKSSVEINVRAGPSAKLVPVAMYASNSRIDDFGSEFMELACNYLTAATELLGDYPFSRLDLVLMPRCFACMGLESPNLAFLSQSLLCGDRSMSVRIAHEIAHAWFGLLIGVKDWTEEWLSEGFATYLEERIQAHTDKLSFADDLNRVRLRQAIRYRSLKSELSEAEENLKSLRPRPVSSGYVSAAEAIRRSIAGENMDEPTPHTLLNGALIPSRKWTQVHYLKGYFLLYYLSQMVGQDSFDNFLCTYVDRYRECLVSSEIFFSMFADHFKISTEMRDQIMNDWLDSSGIPPEVDKMLSDDIGSYVLQVNEKFLEWKKRDTGNKRCRTLKQKRKKLTLHSHNQTFLTPDQVILLLEKLLERDTLSHHTLNDLQLIHSLDSCNAEIRHRWCELIVKHKYCKRYDQVRKFLTEDQGMGIYLFGELLISEDAKQKRLANDIFKEIKDEMDGCTYQTVYEMLNGI